MTHSMNDEHRRSKNKVEQFEDDEHPDRLLIHRDETDQVGEHCPTCEKHDGAITLTAKIFLIQRAHG